MVSGALPEFWNLERSVDRVTSRWPDAVQEPDERDRDQLCREMLRRVTDWDWQNVPMMRVTSTAVAAFDKIRCNSIEFAPLREFLINETAVSKSPAFRAAMLSVYVGSYHPDATHTRTLAKALSASNESDGPRMRALLEAFPALLSAPKAHLEIADRMTSMENPYQELQLLGIRSPHAPGMMQHAHLAFVNKMSSAVATENGSEKMIHWLMPDGIDALQSGAQSALEALLRPWITASPSDELQSQLTESIIDGYGDPRLQTGGVWAGFSSDLKDVMLRWLTQQSMEYFCDVVTATQPSHMWEPRRDFWLDLFHQGRIDAAWVAFGSAARRYAFKNLVRQGETNPGLRFGRQHERAAGTSLLIMKFGNRIVVDGCHSYKTHIFVEGEDNTPRLYQRDYYCDRIMRSATRSKSHSSLHTWRAWVERNI